MAQTIAEKLAEKYDVTPSTTIAGTLKKITNDETGDVNIASLVGKMEAGGGSSRVLLYENEAATFQSGDDWHYATANTLDSTNLNACFNPLDGDYTLVIDGEEYTSTLTQDSNVYYMGVQNPGDSEHVGVNKMGVVFSITTVNSIPYVVVISMIMISATDFNAGTHSVKIYKEV